MKTAVAVLAIVAAALASVALAGNNKIPAQFHGLWCGDGNDPDNPPNRPLKRVRSKYCPRQSGDVVMFITADGFEASESRCKLLEAVSDKTAAQLKFTCGYKGDGWETNLRLSIVNGKLRIEGKPNTDETEKEKEPENKTERLPGPGP
jgi:hypothetical protein